MPKASRSREGRLRKTKAQLIDELETLERRIAGPEGGGTLLTDVIESIPEGFSYYDADDRLVLCNKAHKDIFGYSDTEAVPGASYVDLIRLDIARGIVVRNEEGGDGYLRRRKKRRRQAAGAYEMQLADGRWIQIRDCRTASGGLVSIQSDVTGLKRAEKALRESERRYETITANIPGVVYERVLHPDGGISFPYVSAGLRETHSLDPEEVMRDPAAWSTTTHPDDRERLEKSNAESLEKLEDWNLEYRIVARDGTTKWLRGTSHVRRDATGDVVWDGVLLDITEEHLSQQRISDLAKFPSEDPNPIVRVTPEAKVLYANDAARAVYGLVVGGKRSMLTRKLGNALEASSRGGKGQEQEFTSGDRIFAFVFTPVPGKSYINVYGRDVTEEHRAKQELVTARERSAAAEALLRDAIDNISDGFVVYDSDGRLVTCNQKWKNIYGYSAEDAAPGVKYEDLVRLDLAKGVVADQRGQAEAYYKHRLAYRKEQEGAFEVELVDGRWILIRERPTSSGGRVGIQADITERKRAEEALRESEERYALAMRAIDEGVYEWNVNTEEFYYSPGVRDILGLPVEEVKSREDFLERIHPDDRQCYRDAYVALFKGETERLNCDVRYRDSEGDWRWTRQHAVVVRDEKGGVHRVVGASGDITELMQREQALRESEQFLATVLDNLPAAVGLRDRNGRYIRVNPQYEKAYGVTNDVARGRTLPEVLPKNTAEEYAALDREAIKQRQAVVRELTVKEADGEHIVVATYFPVLDPSGDVIATGVVDHDITERKEAEQALRQNQALFDQAAQLAHLGHWAHNEVEDRVIYCSEEVARIHGVTVDEHLASLSSTEKDIERAHPEDRDKLGRVLRQAQKQATAYDVEYRIVRPDGEIRHVREMGEPVLDDSGSLIRSFGTIQDITERKRAEETLRDSREMLFAVVNAVPAMINAKDRDSRYVFINRYQAELYGVSEDEAIGKTAGNLLGRKYGAQTRRLDRKVIESGEALPHYEEDHTDAHGVRRELLATKVPLKDKEDQVRGIVTVALDISDRKRAEQALKESETRFVQAARLANLGHWAWDEIEDRCTYCSEELARIHGFTVDEYLAATNNVEGDLARIHPDDRVEYYRVTRVWANRQDTYDIEYRIVQPDGKVRHVRELAEAIRDETGRMVRSFGTLQDITERKRAEEELLEAKRQSEEAGELVAEKNRMLESLSNQLSKYLSPQVYASIFSGEQSVEIASKRKKLTVFFSDIANFTGTTDSLESEELTNLLNHYLTEMSKIALDHGATIDKYVGDAIIAFFGDPETRGVKEDARTCVNMAIAMQRRMQELQSEWLDMGLERPFQLRIGINTGFCTVGNFGSGDRMDYTIIGNEVNLAARLESLTEVGGILMAHETHSLVKDTVMSEEGDTLTVKGFARPVRTYRVIGRYDDLAEQGRVIRKEQDGIRVLVDLKKGDKADAIQAIEDVLSQLKG
ncbi:MAG: PAS domain S-box protein [Alphaproteobacteria bacterium]|nr:PAS domain S-box protein [Alphaproteobacteria bacterium]